MHQGGVGVLSRGTSFHDSDCSISVTDSIKPCARIARQYADYSEGVILVVLRQQSPEPHGAIAMGSGHC